MSDPSIIAEIHRLRGLTVGQLRIEWKRLYNGEETRSRNRVYLWRRLAWRVQELQLGGLSDRAKQRIAELAPDRFVRGETPKMHLPEAPPPASSPPRNNRDPRLPAIGTVISRQYRGRELRLTVLDHGFELDGARYGSLSEAARAVTGQHWNGRLFWGLTQRKRKA